MSGVRTGEYVGRHRKPDPAPASWRLVVRRALFGVEPERSR